MRKKFTKLLRDVIKNNVTKEKKDFFKEYSLFEKNFMQNSKTSFEYYDFKIYKYYSDFVLKDNKGTIHIFEVKSVNKSYL